MHIMRRVFTRLFVLAAIAAVISVLPAYASPAGQAASSQFDAKPGSTSSRYQLAQQQYQRPQRRRRDKRRRKRSLPEALAPLILRELTRPRARREPPPRQRRRARPRRERQTPRAQQRPTRRAQPRFQPVPAPDMPLPAPKVADMADPDGRDPLTPLPQRRVPPQPVDLAGLFENKPHRPREIVVRIATADAEETQLDLMRDYNVVLVARIPIELLSQVLVHFRLPGNRDLPQLVAALNADPRVISAQPNYIYQLLDDGQDASQQKQYSLAALRIPPARGLATGRDVRIAVIDTCIDTAHAGLAGVIERQFDAFARTEQDVSCNASQPHGTAIAGIISARGELRGIAPRARLFAARAFGYEGAHGNSLEATTVTLVSSLDWAAEQGARIYNLSFAGPEDPVMRRMMEELAAGDHLLVGAAGNEGPDAPPVYPAAYDGVLAVTAVDVAAKPYGRANHGDYIDLAAPGVDVLVIAPGNSYDIASGTSYAAAHISGVIALMLEKNASMNGGILVDSLRQTARDLGQAGHDPTFGAGLADTQGAMQFLSGVE